MFIHSNERLAPLGKILFSLDAVNGGQEEGPRGFFRKCPNSLDVLENLRDLEKINRNFVYGPDDNAWTGPDYQDIKLYVLDEWDNIPDIDGCESIKLLNDIERQFSDHFSTCVTSDLTEYVAFFYYPGTIPEFSFNEERQEQRKKAIKELVDKCFNHNFKQTTTPQIPDMHSFIALEFDALVRDNDPSRLEENVLALCRHPYYKHNSMAAFQAVILNTNEKDLQKLNQVLFRKGCTGPESTAAYVTGLLNKAENQPNQQKKHTVPGQDELFHSM
jgi:hypothetical protein